MFWNWKVFDARAIAGVMVKGDTGVPATTVWNWSKMKRKVWKTVAVFQVDAEVAARGYRIGYIPTKGGESMVWKARRNSVVFYDQVFRVRIGAEDCTFFVTRGDSDEEVVVRPIACEDKDTGEHRDCPLR